MHPFPVRDTGAQNSAKAITAYSLNGATGTIDETAKTIAVNMPNGTDVTALVATFSTTGAGVTAGTAVVPQESGTTPNDFTSPVSYTITAADSTTATYTVTVAHNSAKAITAYSINGVDGTIDETATTIVVTMPHGTDRTALVATFTTIGTGVTVGTAVKPQVSGTTSNDFTSPVAYTVTAADSTTVIYTVTVNQATVDAKAITAYSINGVAGTINETAKTIALNMPKGTNVTALIAKFTTTGTGVTAGNAALPQTSGTTSNNFTSPVIYTVNAYDTSTAIYTVTITVSAAAGPAPVNLGTAGNFVILAKSAVSTTGTTKVVGDIGVSPAAASFITGFGMTADSTNTFST